MDEHRKELLKNLPKIDEMMLRIDKGEGLAGFPREIVKEACRTVVEDLRAASSVKRGGEFRLPTREAGGGPGRGDRRGLPYLPAPQGDQRNGGDPPHEPRPGAALPGSDGADRRGRPGILQPGIRSGKGRAGAPLRPCPGAPLPLSGAEDALVVNNNAAAVLLVLNTLAEGKEAIVSRGELIEIGGEFRIPEVMEKSGARLREVGTTNRTRLPTTSGRSARKTGIILKVHTSNFRIMGFTEEADLASLVALGKRRDFPSWTIWGAAA